MWKIALCLVLLFVAGHFAVRYLRTNPLDPVLENGELTVSTSEHEVTFALEGAVEGSYLVAQARSRDWSDEPANAALAVVDLAVAKDYLRSHPELHGYGPATSGLQLENLSAPLDLIAANRLAYGDLHGLVDSYADRVEEHGNWLCLSIGGDALRVTSARTLEGRTDSTGSFTKRAEAARLLLVTRVRVEDCKELFANR